MKRTFTLLLYACVRVKKVDYQILKELHLIFILSIKFLYAFIEKAFM